MTVDIQKLKALANDAQVFAGLNGELSPAQEEFIDAANPAAVLELIAQTEEDAMHMRAFGEVRRSQAEQIDHLKAENEALRKDAERYRWLRAETGLGPNIQVSEWVGPHEYRLHGEELDIAVDGALSKESSHD